MFQPRLNNCEDCTTIPALLSDIDCKLTELGKKQYNNLKLNLGYFIPNEVMFDLLNYKRILEWKYCNPDYAPCYSVTQIASKVKILIYK